MLVRQCRRSFGIQQGSELRRDLFTAKQCRGPGAGCSRITPLHSGPFQYHSYTTTSTFPPSEPSSTRSSPPSSSSAPCSLSVEQMAQLLTKNPQHLQHFIDSLSPEARRNLTVQASAVDLHASHSDADQNRDGKIDGGELVRWLQAAVVRRFAERDKENAMHPGLLLHNADGTLATSTAVSPADGATTTSSEGSETKSPAVETAKAINDVQPPTVSQLRRLMLSIGIPYIGFGFTGNTIMLVIGHAIETNLSVWLGISAMACAALGNAFADSAGVCTGSAVQSITLWLGFLPPNITPEQAALPVTRTAATAGGMIGVIIGCLLGLVPLFFFNDDEPEEAK